MTTFTKIQNRRGAAATWTTKNPVLNDGEIGVESDTYRFKIGDGITAWNALAYFFAPVSGSNIKSLNGTTLLGSGDFVLPPGIGVNVNRYADIATAVTAIGSTPTILDISADTTVSTALTIPLTLYLRFAHGAKLVKSGSGTINFQGLGLDDAQSQDAIFSGFAAGDITWTGTNYPAVVSSSLWADTDLSDKLLRAIAALNGKQVTIKTFPGNFGSPWTLRNGQSLYLTRGTYTNTVNGAFVTMFLLESNTRVYGDGMGQTIVKESGVVNSARTFGAAAAAFNPFDGASSNIHLSDFTILGDPAQPVDSSASAIGVGNTKGFSIRNIYFDHTHGFGVYAGGFGFSGNHAENGIIEGCIFDGLQTQQTGTTNGRNITWQNNKFINISVPTSPSQSIIDIEPNDVSDVAENLQIIDNIIDARNAQMTANGITVQAGGAEQIRNIRISGNVILGADNYQTQGLLSSAFSSVTNQITAYGHGYLNTTVVQLTTSGTLPAGLLTGINYYIIKVDNDHVKLASSYANAVAGTAVTLTSAAGSGTHNIIPIRQLAGGIQVAGADNVLVNDNLVQGTGQSAVAVSNAARVVVQNNIARIAAGGGTPAFSLTSVADSDIYANKATLGTPAVSQDTSAAEIESTLTVNTTAGSPNVTRTAGTLFYPFWTGKTITIGGIDYTVKAVTDLQTLITTANQASTATGTPLTTKFSNNTFRENKFSSVALSGTGTSQILSNYADVVATRDTAQTLTNKTINGASNTLTVLAGTQLSGQAPIANGGSGQSSANAALNAFLPTQTGNANKFLQTNGTNTSWATAGLGVGNAVTGGGINRVLFEDGSQNLAASQNFTFNASPNQLLLTGTNASDVPFAIKQPASPTGNAIEVNSSAGSGGDIFKVNSAGSINIPNAQAYQISGSPLLTYNNGTGTVNVGNNGISQTALLGTTRVLGGINNVYKQNLDANGIAINSDTQYGWSNATNDPTATKDTGFARTTAGVIRATDGGSNGGWFQQEGVKRLTSNYTNATSTMSNLTDLTANVKAGRVYSGSYTFIANNSTAAEGFKLDFNGGSATFTSLEFVFEALPIGATIGTRSSTAAATAIALSALGDTSDVVIKVYFTAVINAAGTLIPRASENTHASGTLTLKAGSMQSLNDMP